MLSIQDKLYGTIIFVLSVYETSLSVQKKQRKCSLQKVIVKFV